MTKYEKWALLALRLSLGWYMFHAGITKVINPAWSAAGYLKGAKTFGGFYQALTNPSVMPIVNFVNEWGLTLLGVSLILGVGVRLSGKLGALLMMLYYFPVLEFPMIGRAYLVDEHVIYAAALLLLSAVRAGRTLGLDAKLAAHPFFAKHPKLLAALS
jgi:thiosulfate dehydrogenase (quinone) large subunit